MFAFEKVAGKKPQILLKYEPFTDVKQRLKLDNKINFFPEQLLARILEISPKLSKIITLSNYSPISGRWVNTKKYIKWFLIWGSACCQCAMWKLYMKNLWCTKNEDNFVLHNNEILIFSWHVIIFLLLRDDENISPWHNTLKTLSKIKI